jgi:hypothetical protein
MKHETSETVQVILNRLLSGDRANEEKLIVAREIVKATFPPESLLAKELESNMHKENPDAATFIRSALAVLPIYTEAISTAAKICPTPPPALPPDELANRIQTEVRLSLNEKFMSSWIFRLCVAALAAAATLFTFGLFTLSTEVRRADSLVDEFHSKLAGEDKRLNEQEDILKDRLRQANNEMANQIEKAQLAARDAQRDSMASLNKNLSDKVAAVEESKNHSVRQIDGLVQDAKNEIEGAVKTANGSLETVRANEQTQLQQKAQEIVKEMKSPTIRSVLGRSYYWMIGTMILAALSIIANALKFFRR